LGRVLRTIDENGIASIRGSAGDLTSVRVARLRKCALASEDPAGDRGTLPAIDGTLVADLHWNTGRTLWGWSSGLGAMTILILAAAHGAGCQGSIGDSFRDLGVYGDDGAPTDGGDGAPTDGGDRDVVDGGDGAEADPLPGHGLLTRIAIDAEAEITSEMQVPATLEIGRYGDDTLLAEGIHIGIKIRGHLSLNWPKKNYSVEAWDARGHDSTYDFLGMGPDEDWVLHGPYADRSLLHNVIINHISNQIGRYAPETRLTSLAIRTPGQLHDGELGVYVLMERIRFSKHRLPVDGTTPGGSKKAFLMRIDWTDSDEPYRTTAQNTPIFFVYPPDKSRTEEEENTALAVLDRFEASLDTPEEALKQIDQPAAADYFILTELAKNPDGYRTSFYFHIPVDGLITFGPIWDFDLAFGVSQWDDGTRVEGWQYEHQEARYFGQLLAADTFRKLIQTRWQQLRQAELSDAAFATLVNAYVARIGPDAIEANNELWPVSAGDTILGLAPEVAGLTEYNQVVDYLIDYGQSRMQWIDAQTQSW
jgi:hypothetical protein